MPTCNMFSRVTARPPKPGGTSTPPSTPLRSCLHPTTATKVSTHACLYSSGLPGFYHVCLHTNTHLHNEGVGPVVLALEDEPGHDDRVCCCLAHAARPPLGAGQGGGVQDELLEGCGTGHVRDRARQQARAENSVCSMTGRSAAFDAGPASHVKHVQLRAHCVVWGLCLLRCAFKRCAFEGRMVKSVVRRAWWKASERRTLKGISERRK